ncbi:4-oxalocrotonate tautomerase [Holophaga foetida]|uniref:4-oxalocrotonate tautomerase n=1 Tax=Holophaga foetida TaxID=35839 RepID=UPI00024749DF|nr:4-oxalocrotonate tautomerase [Holophaga foetida]
MPIVQVNLIEGRTLEQKRRLVAEITNAVVNCVDAPPDAVKVILNEMPRENYASAGVLYADKK